MKRQTRARAAFAAATVLAVDAAAHLYWTTGATWPAPDVRTLSLALLNVEVPFTPRVLLPLATALLTASAALLTTTRLDSVGGGASGVGSAGDRSVGDGDRGEVGRVGAWRMPGPLVGRVVRLVTGVLAIGVLVRAVLGLVWTLGFGVQTSTPFYWLNALLYTPLCLALFVAVVVARGTAAPADGPARDHGVKIS
ncbi:DUF3995 domain-containing protein [Nonomuraea dietziae]|uniref:DUF3995 domain-containing protein n=1 Tax=Nonomuraea dietziae TaxID=65515 RepID=UPI0033C379A9